MRTLSANYYLPKATAQKITRIFSKMPTGELSPILAEAAVSIFRSFESQFTEITDKAGDKVAMEKLAEDGVGRVLNYLAKYTQDDDVYLSKQLIEKGLLIGPSEKFFDPSIKNARIRISGTTVRDKSGNKINTANLYEKVGIVNAIGSIKKFYNLIDYPQDNQYGYRQIFNWEKEENGELKQEIKDHYIEAKTFDQETAFEHNSRNYQYSLGIDTQQKAQAILTKIENRTSRVPDSGVRPALKKNAIFFNLRNPIANFVGREQVLKELHSILLAGKVAAITTAMSTLSLGGKSGSNFLESSAQISVCGLGGVGKTQLALQYAQLHAAYYDNNVLWIDAETQENFIYSFMTLAGKLQIETKDRYGNEKNIQEIVHETYEYFFDRKSLFILDNVQSYREIKDFLPKSIPGNNINILITSRYSNWKNTASIISLDVFSPEESMELVKKELNLTNNLQNGEIKELATLVQGLPLALQQALAYINLQKNVNAAFGIHHYIELYKEKTRQLLSFNYPSYSNDPYTKTVFTTWHITLDKIQNEPAGEDALAVLNIMAYLCPNSISNNLFLGLKNVDLSSAIHLLKSYSMINPASQQDKTTIHRLVQQVVRINLEIADPNRLRQVIRKTEMLIMDYEGKVENRFHYLHFLLYMTEHAEFKSILQTDNTSREIFRLLPKHDTKHWLYFLNLAYSKFTKEKYLKFIGDALVYYSRSPSMLFLSQTLFYIEKKLKEGVLSKENIKYILERRYYPHNSYYRMLSHSSISIARREQQRLAIELIYSLREKLFKADKEYLLCLAHPLRKRSINRCRLSEAERKRAQEIDKHAIKTHLKNVVQISDWASSGLLAKDILSALIQGEFGMVAIDFGLIGSSILLGKVSNKLLTQGTLLVDNALLFNKDLALESKSALKILLHEEVPFVAKSRFLGQVMRMSSPFVAKGTMVLFAYNLINEIKKYKEGDEKILPEILSNGAIIGIDSIEAGIEASEFLGFITGVSEFTGPIGSAAVALIWFGAEAYHAKKQLEVIETQVHLTLVEKLKQSLRAFFHVLPSEYLEIKAANNELVQNAINFLKNHTEIKNYIFPSFYSPGVLHDKSEIFLDKKRKLILSDSMPDTPLGGNLFCLSGNTSDSITHWLTSETSTYLCKNAIGIEYLVNRTGNLSFVNLKQGEDEMLASSDLPTLFLVETGKKKYKGSDNGNLFILQGGSITGLLQGGNRSDTILLNDFDPQNKYVLHDSRGFLCGKNNSDSFTELYCQMDTAVELKEVEQIYGRKDEKDILYVSQYTNFIDGYGGKDAESPDYLYLTSASHRNPILVLRNNSVVLMLLNTGVISVNYRIPDIGGGEAKVQFPFTEAIQHQFFFDFALTTVQKITILNKTIRFELASPTVSNFSQKLFYLTITDPYARLPRTKLNNTNLEIPDAYYFFQGIEVRLLDENHIYAQEYENTDNRSIDARINSFIKLAQRLGKAFFIQLMNYKSVFIGQKKHEIFYTNSVNENYLVGNIIGNTIDSEDENIYVVSATDAVFPLPKIVIYNSVRENLDDFEMFSDTLDLRNVIERVEKILPNDTASAQLSRVGNDLVLVLSTIKQIQLVRIILKNALLDDWYQKLNVLLDNFPRNIIKANNSSWQLEIIPLTFDSDKEIIVLTQQNLESNAEIFVLKKIGEYIFLREKNNLIITNLFSNAYDRCTIICKHFYHNQAMQEKLLAATFIFFDHQLPMKNYSDYISHAANFSEFAYRFQQVNTTSLGSKPKNRSKRSDKVLFYEVQHNLDEGITSSATRTLSPIQYLLNWMKKTSKIISSTIKHFYAGFFNKKDYFLAMEDKQAEKKEKLGTHEHLIFQEIYKKPLSKNYLELFFKEKNNSGFNKSYFTKITGQFDLSGTLMLSYLVFNKLFNQEAANAKKFIKKGKNFTLFKLSKIAQNELLNNVSEYKSFNISSS